MKELGRLKRVELDLRERRRPKTELHVFGSGLLEIIGRTRKRFRKCIAKMVTQGLEMNHGTSRICAL
jgi:hypothetical protein